jgi:hypothetical protein
MLKSIVRFNVTRVLGDALEQNRWYMDLKTRKYSCEGRAFFSKDKHWVYVNPRQEDACCTVYQLIVDNCGFIPSPCLRCWKVVVKPRTLFELMKLWQFEKEFTADCMGEDRYCKCGIEERPWVHYNYGGYFYCDSLEQGLLRYDEVRAGVDLIDPEIPVILKRYCTEFEIKLGPSDKYERPNWADAMEANIFDAVDLGSIGTNEVQPSYLVEYCLGKWIEFAWDRGDPTAILFNDNEPLYSPCVTYHDKGVTGRPLVEVMPAMSAEELERVNKGIREA